MKAHWKSGIRVSDSVSVPQIVITTCEECQTQTSCTTEEANIATLCKMTKKILDTNGKRCDTCVKEYYRRQLKPWDMDEGEEEKSYPIWQAFQSDDFFFAVASKASDKGSVVFIVPKRYYDIYHTSYHYSMPITDILPIDLVEVSPSVFETELDEQEITDKLKSIGFIHNEKFQESMHEELMGFLSAMGFWGAYCNMGE